jgi:hypothetical protein
MLYLAWIFAKIVCSSTKQGLTCTRKVIMVVLEKAHQQKAPFLLQKVLQSLCLVPYQTPDHRYIIEESKGCFKVKEEKDKWQGSGCS